ncbi:MAG: tyrosine-type recombinase/integrase [Chitinivibrionales bacterium]|nr:tyrosine-type recombinase/integrase [Chitinivibrionales bacterium]
MTNSALLTAFLESLRREGLRALTIEDYRSNMSAFFAYLALHPHPSPFAADTDTLSAYCASLTCTTDRPRTVWRKHHAVYRFFEWLRLSGMILINPCPVPILSGGESLPRNVPTWELLSRAYRQLSSITEHHYWVGRDLAILDLAYACGLRRCELQRLNLEDIALAEGTLRVRGKGERERLVPFGNRTTDTLEHYLYEVRPRLAVRPTTRAVFISWQRGGKRMALRSINAIFRRLHRRYGLDRSITPHNLRHAFATDLLRHGAPVQDVSQMLGHAKLETTTIYTRVMPRDLKNSHARCHPRG